MKCPECHSVIDNDAKFCPLCGTNLTIVCPKCSQENKYPARFCKNCGEKLIEETEAKEEKPRRKININKEKALPILNIVSMSLMLVSMLIMLGLIFAPFGSDDFFPASMFTIIGYISNMFKVGIDTYVESNQYLIIVHSFVLLGLLAAYVIGCVVLTSLNITKFIKNVKAKTYYDFSKLVTILLIGYLLLAIYFTRFAINNNGYYLSQPGAIPTLVFILIPSFLAINMFTKEYSSDEHQIKEIIYKSSIKLVSLILFLTIAYNLGGAKIYVIASNFTLDQTMANKIIQTCVNNTGLIDTLLMLISQYYEDALPMIINSIVLAGASMFIELLMMAIILFLFNQLFKIDLKQQTKPLLTLIFAGVLLIFAIVSNVLDSSIPAILNQIDSNEVFAATIKCNISNSQMATNIVISSIFLALSLGSFIYEKTAIKRGVVTNE